MGGDGVATFRPKRFLLLHFTLSNMNPFHMFFHPSFSTHTLPPDMINILEFTLPSKALNVPLLSLAILGLSVFSLNLLFSFSPFSWWMIFSCDLSKGQATWLRIDDDTSPMPERLQKGRQAFHKK